MGLIRLGDDLDGCRQPPQHRLGACQRGGVLTRQPGHHEDLAFQAERRGRARHAHSLCDAAFRGGHITRAAQPHQDRGIAALQADLDPPTAGRLQQTQQLIVKMFRAGLAVELDPHAARQQPFADGSRARAVVGKNRVAHLDTPSGDLLRQPCQLGDGAFGSLGARVTGPCATA